MNKPIKLHIGCGWRNFGKEWIHIDGGNYDHLDYKSITDLAQFKNNSVDLIYASHVFEYFDRKEAADLLKEWHRILKLGGILRLAVPDFNTMIKLYFFNQITLNNILGPLYGKMKMDDKIIYHKTVYDFTSIEKILFDNGFNDIKRYEWRETEHNQFDDHSQAYIPHMDKENGTLISLNVEATKI